MIQINIDGKTFAFITPEGDWTRITMLVRKGTPELVLLLDTTAISVAAAYKLMDEMNADVADGNELRSAA